MGRSVARIQPPLMALSDYHCFERARHNLPDFVVSGDRRALITAKSHDQSDPKFIAMSVGAAL